MNNTVNVTYVRQYSANKNGKRVTVFVYRVSGTPELKAKYKELQGTFYRPDTETNEPLYFTKHYMGTSGTLILTDSGKVVPDMSKYEKAASLCDQFDGVFGQTLAHRLVSDIMGTTAPANSGPINDPNSIPDEDLGDI